jgi:uncharacterized protein (TIGR02246 family)
MSRPLTTPTEDERAIRGLISRWEAAWNASDSVAFSMTMVENVDFISVLGDRYNGREIVERGHRHIFDTIYKDSRVTYTVEALRFLKPDVAVALMHQKIVSRLPPGAMTSTARQMQVTDKMHENEARATVVVTKDQTGWHIAAVHNTSIAPKTTHRS